MTTGKGNWDEYRPLDRAVFVGSAIPLAWILYDCASSNLPETARWIYDLSPGLRVFIGVAELLGAAGLILPGLTRIRTGLTPLAALGLALIMILAIVFHLQRGEGFIINVVVLVLSAFVAYGRWRVKQLPGREESRGRPVRPLA